MRIAMQAGVYMAAALLFAFTAGPVILTFLGSIQPDKALFAYPPQWFSRGITFDNYWYILFGEVPEQFKAERANQALLSQAAKQIPGAIWNSFVVAFWVMIVNIVVSSPAAYAFARLRFRFKFPTFFTIVVCRLLPVVSLVAPFYLLMEGIGLIGTPFALVLVHSVQTLPFTMLILTLFFKRVPREIEEAAMVDGATSLQSFLRVMIPISAASIVTTGLFAFMLSYAEFLYALVLTGEAEDRTLSVILAVVARNVNMSWGLINAGVFLAMLPTLLLVIVVWRFVVEGVVAGTGKT